MIRDASESLKILHVSPPTSCSWIVGGPPVFWLKHSDMTRLSTAGAGRHVPPLIELANTEAGQQLADWAPREAAWGVVASGEASRVISIPRDAAFGPLSFLGRAGRSSGLGPLL